MQWKILLSTFHFWLLCSLWFLCAWKITSLLHFSKTKEEDRMNNNVKNKVKRYAYGEDQEWFLRSFEGRARVVICEWICFDVKPYSDIIFTFLLFSNTFLLICVIAIHSIFLFTWYFVAVEHIYKFIDVLLLHVWCNLPAALWCWFIYFRNYLQLPKWFILIQYAIKYIWYVAQCKCCFKYFVWNF